MILKHKSIVVKSMVAGFVTTLLLSGCGGSSSSASKGADAAYSSDYKTYEEAAYDYDYAYDMADSVAEENGVSAMPSSKKADEVQDNSRKLIKTVNMTVETNDMDGLLNDIESKLENVGGYIEYSNIDNGSAKYKNSSRSASLTIRVPSKSLDSFLNNVSDISNVITKNTDVTDVTLQYVDVEAKKESLKTQEKRLLELLGEADSIDEIIYIDEKLTEIQYQMDSAERQLRSYDNQVDYSTISLNISEVVEFTPIDTPSRWEKMAKDFVDNIYGVCGGFLDFIAGFIAALPYLVFWAIIILLVVLIVKACIKLGKKSKEKKLLKQQEDIKKRYAEEMKKKELEGPSVSASEVKPENVEDKKDSDNI